MEVSTETPTPTVLSELPDITACKALDHFAYLVLMSSTLGHVVRYSLQQSTGKSSPPWDFRSDFAKISSILLRFSGLLRKQKASGQEQVLVGSCQLPDQQQRTHDEGS
jgi:hypothetical protein